MWPQCGKSPPLARPTRTGRRSAKAKGRMCQRKHARRGRRKKRKSRLTRPRLSLRKPRLTTAAQSSGSGGITGVIKCKAEAVTAAETAAVKNEQNNTGAVKAEPKVKVERKFLSDIGGSSFDT